MPSYNIRCRVQLASRGDRKPEVHTFFHQNDEKDAAKVAEKWTDVFPGATEVECFPAEDDLPLAKNKFPAKELKLTT